MKNSSSQLNNSPTDVDRKDHVGPRDIPPVTLEVLARTFFRDAQSYGFQTIDYVRFATILLDLARNSVTACRAVDSESVEFCRSTPDQLPLVGDRVGIRCLDVGRDRTMLGQWLDDRAGRLFLLSRVTAKVPQLQDLVSDPANVIGVVTDTDETPFGLMAFLDIDPVQRKAELRKLIGVPQMRGKGLGLEASRLWIEFGRCGLNLRKITVNTLGSNIRNIHVNEELGFRVEGILREELRIDGEYHDVLRMGLCF